MGVWQNFIQQSAYKIQPPSILVMALQPPSNLRQWLSYLNTTLSDQTLNIWILLPFYELLGLVFEEIKDPHVWHKDVQLVRNDYLTVKVPKGERVLPIMDYARMLHPKRVPFWAPGITWKGVPFSGWRYVKLKGYLFRERYVKGANFRAQNKEKNWPATLFGFWQVEQILACHLIFFGISFIFIPIVACHLAGGRQLFRALQFLGLRYFKLIIHDFNMLEKWIQTTFQTKILSLMFVFKVYFFLQGNWLSTSDLTNMLHLYSVIELSRT